MMPYIQGYISVTGKNKHLCATLDFPEPRFKPNRTFMGEKFPVLHILFVYIYTNKVVINCLSHKTSLVLINSEKTRWPKTYVEYCIYMIYITITVIPSFMSIGTTVIELCEFTKKKKKEK